LWSDPPSPPLLVRQFDPDYEPTREDVEDYAEVIGLDLNADPDLEWIAREGLCK
jgi:centrosomal protein CEP164